MFLNLADVIDLKWNAFLILSTNPNLTFLQILVQRPVPNNSTYLYHTFIALNFYLSFLI